MNATASQPRGPSVSTATKGPAFMAVSITLRRRAFKVEDGMMLGSMIFTIVMTIVGNMSVHYGFGRHMTSVNALGGNLIQALMYYWIFQIVYKFALCLIKLALLSLYLNIFSAKKGLRKIIWATIAVITMMLIGFTFSTIFQCTPIRKAWQRKLPGGHCVNNAAFRWSWAAINTITDLWVWMLPTPSLWLLQMSKPHKLALMGVFSLGLFCCLASALRMHALVQSTTNSDTTWDAAPAFIWSAVEANVGLICACLPAFKHLLCGCVIRDHHTAQSYSNGPDGLGNGSRSHALSNLDSRKNNKGSPFSINIYSHHSNDSADERESVTGILKADESKDAGIQITRKWSIRSDTPSGKHQYTSGGGSA
ncbi:hypothetical protein MBLNU459_g6017t2 [Dothideomycetes sp. NU459]